MAGSEVSSLVALTNQNNTLWKEAYEKFKGDSEMFERLQSTISKDSNVTKNVGQEQQLGDLLIRKRRIMEDKQWVLHWRKKGIKIGPQFDMIVKIFKSVKPIGDTAAGLDPIHAGIPWACVSILLPLILNHSEEQEMALNGLQKVAEIVQQFTSFSWDYLNIPTEKSEKQLKESIVTLYWKILRYEATAINNFSRHTISRYAASIVRKDDWKTLLKDIEDYRNNFMTDLQLNDSQTQKRFESELRELIQGLDRTDEKNFKIIQWISVKPYVSQHYTARQLLVEYPHAGKWIIEKYTKWLHCDGAPAFWLRGTIGTGKTSIVLVSQLAWTLNGNAIEQSIVDMFNNAQPPDTTLPTPEDWLEALLKLFQRVRKVIIVIDALDECVDFSKLLTMLKRLQVQRVDCVSFLFSSRLNVDVDKVFPGSDGIILTAEDTSKDMSRYIEDEVKSKEGDIECEDEAVKKQLINRITLVLINSAGGMFKWVTLQLAIMFPIEGQTFFPENIQIQLQNIENRNVSLEQSLNDAYETVYTLNTKLGIYNSSVSMALYKWLLCCETPLCTEEVIKIIELSLDHDPKFKKVTRNPLSTKVLLHCCSNFVIQSAENTFRFAHLSVEEYLINHCAVKAEFQPEKCHLFAMKMCLALITSKRIKPVSRQEQRLMGSKEAKVSLRIAFLEMVRNNLDHLLMPSSFLCYSVSYWAHHTSRVSLGMRSRELSYKSFVLCSKISPSLQWWYSQINAGNFRGNTRSQIREVCDNYLGGLSRSGEYPLKSRLSILGAAFNLPEVIEIGLNKYRETIDESAATGLTPLLVAIRHGSPDSVKYLLDQGANPQLNSFVHRHHIKNDNVGRPTADENMVFWATAKDGASQKHIEEHLKVEEILLNHERSRQPFLFQLERFLRIDAHPEPPRAFEALYHASNETPISAKIFKERVNTKGLGELVDVLDRMDEKSFDDEMVLEVIRLDSAATVERVFEFKKIDSLTPLMVRNALRSRDYKTLAYFVAEFNFSILTQELVIDEKLRRQGTWRVILDAKGTGFVTQEVFDSLFDDPPGTRNIVLMLEACGTGMIRSSHLEVIAGVPLYSLEVFATVRRKRGSLEGLITEEVIVNALDNDNSELVKFILHNFNDPTSLLTKRVEEVAKQNGMMVRTIEATADSLYFNPDLVIINPNWNHRIEGR
ncbi:hypothetical protein EYC80_009886 [Monilinia laxa]|uniref:Uncharacterized protein n=1 Tax=Monilinia laxa TaxID=61186 RepID=A0A5N6JRM8_MONLA|nr:hypothetical protein EYC80_009886 [Monilinia laxa]